MSNWNLLVEMQRFNCTGQEEIGTPEQFVTSKFAFLSSELMKFSNIYSRDGLGTDVAVRVTMRSDNTGETKNAMEISFTLSD